MSYCVSRHNLMGMCHNQMLLPSTVSCKSETQFILERFLSSGIPSLSSLTDFSSSISPMSIYMFRHHIAIYKILNTFWTKQLSTHTPQTSPQSHTQPHISLEPFLVYIHFFKHSFLGSAILLYL